MSEANMVLTAMITGLFILTLVVVVAISRYDNKPWVEEQEKEKND